MYPGKDEVEFLTETEEKDFLMTYISKRLELMNQPGTSISDTDVDKLYSQCVLYKPVS